MNIDYTSIKSVLSPKGQEKFDDVATQRVLGATSHTRLISEMFLDITSNAKINKINTKQMVGEIQEIANFFIKTRGEASQAVSNAIHLMLNGITSCEGKKIMDAVVLIENNIKNYLNESENNLRKINNFIWEIIKDMKSIMLFDYSSTVNNISSIAKNHGMTLECYIPQSTVLDGGKPYIKALLENGHKVHFIPDAAMFYYIKKCDAAFIGAETFYHDGRAFNTVGSELLALLCKEFIVPFYVLTPLIKLDIRALYGYKKPQIIIDAQQKTGATLAEGERKSVDFTCPELVEIPAAYINAFVTEVGIIPPTGMYTASLNYLNMMKEV